MKTNYLLGLLLLVGIISRAQDGKINDTNIREVVSSWINNKSETEEIYGHISDWDVSNVTDMNSLFLGKETFNESISKWDVSNVVDMSRMFEGAKSFNQFIGNWDVSNVLDMSHLFHNASSFNQSLAYESDIFDGKTREEPGNGVNGWNVSKVIDMSYMFSGANDFDKDLKSWNVGQVKDMRHMFSNTSFNQNINSWDIENVTNMSYMFSNSIFNKSLNSWNVDKVEDMSHMFSNSIFNQNIDSWNVSHVSDMSYMFSGTENFNQDLNNWNIDSVRNLDGMFFNSKSFNKDLSNWNTSNVESMVSLFENSKFDYPIHMWNVTLVKDMSRMFSENKYSEINYDKILENWSKLSLQNDVRFQINSSYCDSDSKQLIINNFNWNITDNGVSNYCSNDYIDIPDSNFKDYLINNVEINKYADSEISIIEAKLYEGEISLYYKNISDLTGISFFENITSLNIQRNTITTLDLSKNLKLKDLNISFNPNINLIGLNELSVLEKFDCTQTQLTELNVSNNKQLNELICIGNNLKILDLSSNTKLKELACTSNQIYSIDLSNLNVLKTIWMDYNFVSSIDLTQNIALEELYTDNNPLSELDVSNNKKLLTLQMLNSSISEIDLSQNTNLNRLTIIQCHNISELDLSQNIKLKQVFIPGNNDLSRVNFKNQNNINVENFLANNNPSLDCIRVDDENASYLSNWSVGDNTEFSETCFQIINGNVYIPDSNFKSALLNHSPTIDANNDGEISVEEAENYESILNLYNKNITDLTGIQAFTSIRNLQCSKNNLTSIDISKNKSLSVLNCGENKIRELDVSENQNLTKIWFYLNQLTNLDLSSNIKIIDVLGFGNNLETLNVANGNNSNFEQFNVKNNFLECIRIDSKVWIDNNDNWPKRQYSWGSHSSTNFDIYYFDWDDNVVFSEDCSALSNQDITSNTFKVYPNPATNFITIDSTLDGNYNLVSILGKTALRGTVNKGENTLDISTLDKGIYFLNVTSNRGSETIKIIIE